MDKYDVNYNRLNPHDIPSGGDGWLVAQMQCMVCNHECVSVHPVGSDEFFGECSQCHNMTMLVLYYIDTDGRQIED